MSEVKPLISVVIGTYNQRDVLEKVMNSFNEQNLDPSTYELIIVDSSSTDGTDELLNSFKAKCLYTPIIQENQGKTGARNKGVEEAKSDTIMITDADMIAHPDLLKTHVEAHKQAKVPTCFEGITYNLHKLEWPTQKSNLYPYITRPPKNKSKLGWWYFLTGNISFSKELFYEAGGFDTEFKGYGWEDLELGYRLSKKKIPLIFLKDAINYHYHVITQEEEIERNIKKGESAKILLKIHPELKMFLGLNPLSVWVYNRTKKEGRMYRFIKNKCYTSSNRFIQNFGFWFLKEYNYLQGILSK